MTKLSELLGGDDAEKLLQSSINIGDVFRINMGRDTGIIPKEGDDSRNKFFIVLGFDNYGNAYGGVIINSKINSKIPYEAQILHMPMLRARYLRSIIKMKKMLFHFVLCSLNRTFVPK